MMTPETMKLIVQARLVQVFRQYPRAGLFLSSSCRNALIDAVQKNILNPEELNAKVVRATENDGWSLQAKLAWMDLFSTYKDAYQSNNCAHDTALLQAISDGILAAGNIGTGDNVPVRQLPESKAAE